MASKLKTLGNKLASLPRPSLPEKLSGGRIARIGNYLKNVLDDYRMVLVEIGQDMRAAPLKSSVYISTLTGIVVLCKMNPSETDFNERLINNSLDLLQVGAPIRNPASDNHMQQILHWQNAGQLRYFNMGVFSVMWVDDFDKCVRVFEAQAAPLKVWWSEMPSRVADVGIVGRWWWLERSMKDYDINYTEWSEPLHPQMPKLPDVR